MTYNFFKALNKDKAKCSRNIKKRNEIFLDERRKVSRWWNLSWVLSTKLEAQKRKRSISS